MLSTALRADTKLTAHKTKIIFEFLQGILKGRTNRAQPSQPILKICHNLIGNLIILWLYYSINHNFTQCKNTNQIMGRFWNINLQLSYLHYCPQLYCNFRSSEATLNSTSGSLGRSSFEVTESIEASDTTLHTNSTNGGLLRSQVRFQKFIRHLFIFQWMSFLFYSRFDHF